MHINELMTMEQLFELCGIDDAAVMEDDGTPLKLNVSSDTTLEWGGVAHQLKTLTL